MFSAFFLPVWFLGWALVCRRGRGVWRGLPVCLAPAVFPLPAARWVAPLAGGVPSVAVVGCRLPCLAWVLVAPGVVLSPFLGCVCVLPFPSFLLYHIIMVFTIFFFGLFFALFFCWRGKQRFFYCSLRSRPPTTQNQAGGRINFAEI